MLQNGFIGDKTDEGHCNLTVKYMRCGCLNHRQFQRFLQQAGLEYDDALCYSAKRWINTGAVLTGFVPL